MQTPHGSVRSQMQHAALLAALWVCWAQSTSAAVSDVGFSDVTTRAFAVVWLSDEPVSSATVRVFEDAAGASEITDALSVTVTSTGFLLGIVKVNVSGVAAETCLYVQTETTASSSTVDPPSPPFPEICTQATTTKANALGELIVSDLIRHELLSPDGATPAAGALMLLSVPGLGAYPLSAFAGDGIELPDAFVDLNNLFGVATSSNVEVVGGDVLEIAELRGLLCPELDNQLLLRFRRAPVHEEQVTLGVRITELENPEPCFFANTVCDDTINILDVQRVLNFFGTDVGECRFNPDLDIIPDGTINILDVQSVLNRFGQSAPFDP